MPIPTDLAVGFPERDVHVSGQMVEIDAEVVALGLGISPREVNAAIQAGIITTLCERGTGEDAGLLRATFYLGRRRLRVVVDAQGRVVGPQSAAGSTWSRT